jgi:hypothetical protein
MATYIPASNYEAYASPWAFGGSTSGGGTDTTPTVSTVKNAGWFSSSGSVGLPPKPQDTKIPVYGPDGSIIGYNTTTYTWDGSAWISTTGYEAVPGAASNSNVTILTNKLLAGGFPQSTVDKAKSYFQTLLTDGVSPDAAIDYFYYQPTYTSKNGQTIQSPYQTDFGKFNAGLAQAKSPTEMVNWVLGIRNVGTKYNLDAAYTSDDVLSKLIKNNVSVANYDQRASDSQLAAIKANPNQVASLMKLGYITQPTDLTGFFFNPDIAQNIYEQRAKTAALGTEAVTQQNRFMTFDKSFIEKQAADLAAQGYSAAQIAQIGSKNYASIAANIETSGKLADIYANSTGNIKNIQDVLQQQAFNNVTSTGLQTAAQMEAAAFSGGAGTSGTSTYLRKTSQQQPGSELPFQY